MLKEYDIQGNTFYLLYGRILQPQRTVELDLTCDDVKQVMKESGALFARWIDQIVDYPTNLWYIVLDSFHPVEEYKSRIRTYIRSGFRNYVFDSEVDTDVILEAAWEIDHRLGYSRPSKRELEKHIKSLSQNYKWWVLRDKENHIQGYVLVYDEGSQVFIRSFHILPEAKRKGAAYFVNYCLSEIFLRDMGMDRIIYGLRNLEHKTEVQQWLEEKMFYKKMYVRMQVCLSDSAAIVYMITRPFMNIVKLLPFSPLRKLYAFVKFIYLAQSDKKE